MKGNHCGYLEFTYEVKNVRKENGKTVTDRETRFLRLDLGTITALEPTLTKGKDSSSSNIAGMGPRYNFYVDKGNTLTLDVKFTRLSPTRVASAPGTLPPTHPETKAFWDAGICEDQQQVTPNMTFAGYCSTTLDPEDKYYSTEKWSNAYWIKALEKAIDRWQMKFDGADFIYWGDNLYGDDDPVDDPGSAAYLPMNMVYHVYLKNLTYTLEAGAVDWISGSFSMVVGRKLRSVRGA